MKLAAPEEHDFTFTADGIEYAVGYQENDDVIALSSKDGGDWVWVSLYRFIEDKIGSVAPEEIIDNAYAQFNQYLTDLGVDGIPPHFQGDMKKVLLLIKNNTVFDGSLKRV